MKGEWRASKYELCGQKLSATKKTANLCVASRIMAALVAEQYSWAIPQISRGRLLDLGCGKAPLFGLYRQFCNESVRADWENSEHGNQVVDVHCDLNTSLPFRDGEFDTVILSDVLEHIAKPHLAIQEIRRILKPNGALIGNTPFMYWLHEEPHDYYRYTSFALESLFIEAKLSVEIITPLGGSIELFADLLSRHLEVIPKVGPAIAAVSQSPWWITRNWKLFKRLRAFSSKKVPLAYFFVVRKSLELPPEVPTAGKLSSSVD